MKYLSLNGLKLFYKSLLEKIDKKIENQIDEIEIGGRNLLTGTAGFNISYKSRGNMWSHIVSENYQGLTVRYYDKAWNFYRPVISLKAGVYTFSGYAKGDDALSINIQIDTFDGTTTTLLSNSVFSITSDWKRYSHTFNLNTDSDVVLYFEAREDGGLYECGWKLEKGSLSTDWNPSSEDIDVHTTELSILGWNVPGECSLQNVAYGNTFTQKVGRVDLGNCDYIRYEEKGFTTKIIGIKNVPDRQSLPNIYCNGYRTVITEATWVDGDISMAPDVSEKVYIMDTSYTDVVAFKSAMQGKYLYYELATPITTTIDGNEIGETVSDVRKETTVNLLKPTLETITDVNNITYKNNGDGTYTISGTSTTQIVKHIADNIVISQDSFLTGCKGGSPETFSLGLYKNGKYFEVYDIDNILKIPAGVYQYAYIVVRSGVTIPDNTIIKPMLTTNLNATYDDFVPYTGSTGSLNGDLSALLKRVEELEKKITK